MAIDWDNFDPTGHPGLPDFGVGKTGGSGIGSGGAAVFPGDHPSVSSPDGAAPSEDEIAEAQLIDAFNTAFGRNNTSERRYLFDNLFHGTPVPNTSTLFFKEPEEEQRPEIKGGDVTIRSSDQPWQVVYGACRVGGVIDFVTTDIPLGGEYIHFTNIIAGHEIKTVSQMYVDGTAIPFNTTGDHIYGWSQNEWQLPPLPASQINGYAFISVSDGATSQAVNSDLQSQSDALFPGIITANHRKRGLAYVYNILYFDPEFFPNGFPDIKYLIQGHAGIYDPRDGSTGYSYNAALCIGEYLSNTDYGLGASWGSEIDHENFARAADICDETISGYPQYACNGVFDTSEEPGQILEKLQTTIGGPIEYSNGKWRVYPGTWNEPVITLTEDDMVSSIKVTTQSSYNELFNAVQGTYLSEADGYVITDFPPVTNLTYETQDGERIYKDITLPFTINPVRAQRLAKLLLERHRQAITVEVLCTLKAFQVKVFDNVYLTNEQMGWSSKPFEVRKVEPTFSGNAIAIRLLLRETAEAVFDWNNGEETTVDVAPNTTLPDPTVVPTPTGVTAQSGTSRLYRKSDGTVVSRAYLTWDSTDNPYIKNDGEILIRVRNDTESGSFQTVAKIPGDQTSYYIWDVKDGDTYTFGVRFRNGLNAPSSWSDVQHTIEGKSQPPCIVTGFSGVPNEYGVRLSWNEIPDADRSYYVLLSDDDRANLLTYSEQFDNAIWLKTNSSISADATTSPQSDATADKLIQDATAAASHYITYNNVSVTSGQQYRMSVFAKAEEESWLALWLGSAGFPGDCVAYFDLTNGTIGTIGTGTDSAEILYVGDGWYRCTAYGTADASAANYPSLYLAQEDGSTNFDGDGSGGLYIWGAQLNLPTESDRYIETTTSAATAGTTSEIWRGDQTSYIWPIQVAGTYDLKVYAVDTTGNKSIAYTTTSVTISAPSAPVDLASEISGPDILLSWSEPSSTQFAIREYRIKKDSTIVGRVLGTTFKYRADYTGAATWKIAAIDVKGNVGAEAELEVDIANPGPVTALTTKVVDNNILFFFSAPSTGTLPIEKYELRRGSTFGSATDIAVNAKEYLQYFESEAGIFTYWIVPVDTAGNEGTQYQVVRTITGPKDFVLTAAADIDPEDADTTTYILDTEDLSDDAFYAPVTTGRTWAQHFTDNSYTTIQDFITNGYTIWIEPAETTDAVIEEKIDLGTTLGATIITTSLNETPLVGSVTATPEIQYSSDDISYTSGGAGSSSVFGTNVRYIKTKYTFSNTDDKSISKFDQWHYNVKVQYTTDAGIVEVTSNGQTVSFNEDFVDIVALNLTTNSTNAKVAVYDDNSFPSSFDVYVFNESGVDASGAGVYVSWQARGVISAPVEQGGSFDLLSLTQGL